MKWTIESHMKCFLNIYTRGKQAQAATTNITKDEQ